MSQPSLANQTGEAEVPVQKQKTSVYTVMLIISFFCIVTACVLLYMELTKWGAYPWWNTSEGTPNTQAYYAAPGEMTTLPHPFA